MTILNKLRELILNILDDLKHTRERILWVTISIFVWTLSKTEDAIILGLISGWVSIVLTFYFASQNNKYKQIHDKEIKQLDIDNFYVNKQAENEKK